MNEREYPDDVWHLICDNFIDAKYQMMCLQWCARGLTINDAIKKVKVDAGCDFTLDLYFPQSIRFNPQPVFSMRKLNAGISSGRVSLPVSGRIPFLRPPLTLHEFYNSSRS